MLFFDFGERLLAGTGKKKTGIIRYRSVLSDGRGREDRTPISGFGDRYTTIVLYPCMERVMRIELT